MADDEPSPADRAMAAMEKAARELSAVHDQATSAAEAGATEQRVVSEFVDTVAEALADGMNEPVGFYAGAVAEEAEYYTKTALKQQVKDQSEEYRDDGKPPLGEFIQDRLETVKIIKTSDHRQGAHYVWDFGTFQVETKSGKDGRGHFLFDQLRDYIHESGGVNVARPVQDRRDGDDWRDFVINVLDKCGEEQVTRGPRTEAVETLANKLRRLTGYGTPEAALDHTGVWVICETADIPDWWQLLGAQSANEPRDLPEEHVEQLRVHESVLAPIVEDSEITRSALYQELDARGHTVPTLSGASLTKWVNGSNERFWALTAGIGAPRTYVPDPHGGETAHPLFEDARSDDQQSDDREQDDVQESEPEQTGGGFDSVGDTL